MNENTEALISQDYRKGMLIRQLAGKYAMSITTLRRILTPERRVFEECGVVLSAEQESEWNKPLPSPRAVANEPIDNNPLIAAYSSGENVGSIAIRFRKSRTQIITLLKQLGVYAVNRDVGRPKGSGGKLSPQERDEIVSRFAGSHPDSVRVLAKAYNVTPQTIRNVLRERLANNGDVR